MKGFCQACGVEFTTWKGRRVYCSTTCMKKAAKQRERIRRRGHYKPKRAIDIMVLHARDGGRCQLCGRKLRANSRVPNKRAPTIDHIQPLSKDGVHEYFNVQLACFTCNSIKGSNAVPGGEQFRLFA